jgi:CrcB protein
VSSNRVGLRVGLDAAGIFPAGPKAPVPNVDSAETPAVACREAETVGRIDRQPTFVKKMGVLGRYGGETAAVFAGGSAGTLSREALSAWFPAKVGEWPWATLGVNIIGAFMLGYFTTRLLERLPLTSYRRPLLGTGLCGGLTTFSTMQVETLRMLEAHHIQLAIAYMATNVVLGLLAVRVASAAVRRVRIGVRA